MLKVENVDSDDTHKQKLKIEIETVIEARKKAEVDKVTVRERKRDKRRKRNRESGRKYVHSMGVHCFKTQHAFAPPPPHAPHHEQRTV